MFQKIYGQLASLNLGLWLIGGVMVLLAVGSFAGGGEGAGSVNSMALFAWLAESPLALSWWLWATVGLLAFLALNTVLCSVESLRTKAGSRRFFAVIAPQVMHAGFLLIVFAHLFSAWGGARYVLPVQEGESIGLPGGGEVQISGLRLEIGAMGMPTAYSAEVREPAGSIRTASPNNPVFYRGYGIYLKQVQLYPYRAALVEIHREPGAGLALAGALLFTVGNVVLLAVRRGSRPEQDKYEP
jgi:hypothetical protein